MGRKEQFFFCRKRLAAREPKRLFLNCCVRVAIESSYSSFTRYRMQLYVCVADGNFRKFLGGKGAA
jgi:hypothetical protein